MAQLMENEVFKAFTTYAAIVTVKMILMGPVTVYFRLTRGVGNTNSLLSCWNRFSIFHF